MSIKDEIKKQAEKISNYFSGDRQKAIEQALLERHNKSVEMAAEKLMYFHRGHLCDAKENEPKLIRSLKEKP